MKLGLINNLILSPFSIPLAAAWPTAQGSMALCCQAQALSRLRVAGALTRCSSSSSSSSSSSCFLARVSHNTTHQRNRRNFHLGDVVTHTADSIAFLHHTGLPWYLAIPLVAVGVNFTVRLPVQYYARGLVARRRELNPLVTAWGSRHAASLPRGAGDKAERLGKLRVASLTEKSRRRIYKAWGVQRWKSFAPLSSIIPFVAVSEALRRLSGAPTGWVSQTLGVGSSSEAASMLVDESLKDGGALWFVDLTAMDPYFSLPLLCSALLAGNSWGRMSRDQLRTLLSLDAAAAPKTPMQRIQITFGRLLLLLPTIPLVFSDLPSSIFLYWATSFALSYLNDALISRAIPDAQPQLRAVARRPQALPYLRGEGYRVPKPR